MSGFGAIVSCLMHNDFPTRTTRCIRIQAHKTTIYVFAELGTLQSIDSDCRSLITVDNADTNPCGIRIPLTTCATRVNVIPSHGSNLPRRVFSLHMSHFCFVGTTRCVPFDAAPRNELTLLSSDRCNSIYRWPRSPGPPSGHAADISIN